MISALVFVIMVASFNWFVDPFGYFGRNPFGAYHVYDEKLLKSRMIKGKEYNAVLFGSSRAGTIDTRFTKEWGLNTFNAAFVGAYPEEILFFVENYMIDAKTVIIGFDYYMFNEKCRERINPSFGLSTIDQLEKYAISYYAVKFSSLTLKKYFQNRPLIYSASGSRNMDRQEARNATKISPQYSDILGKWEKGFTCDYQISNDRMKIAQTIIRKLSQTGRKVHIFLQPFHPTLHDRISELGQAPEFDEWRKRMKESFPKIKDLTMGPFSDSEYFYWNDPVHYTQATGKKIIDFILSDITRTEKQDH